MRVKRFTEKQHGMESQKLRGDGRAGRGGARRAGSSVAQGLLKGSVARDMESQPR